MLGKQGDLLGLSHLLAALDTRHQRLVEHALKILLQDIHVVAELGAGDSGIELGGLDIGMAEHLRYRSDRHAVFEGNGGGKGVAGQVEGDILVDPADSGHLLEVFIALLVGEHRQELAARETILSLYLSRISNAIGRSLTFTGTFVFWR